MTKINFVQRPPQGKATIDTADLLIGTDGKAYVRSSHDGRLMPLSEEQQDALARHVGAEAWKWAVESVGALR